MSAPRSTRPLTALLTCLGLVLAALALGPSPAVAGPVDSPWTASGQGATTVSDGSASAASMDYALSPGDDHSLKSWDFTARATMASGDGPVRVPWTWSGFHAYYRVTARLELVVDGEVRQTLVDEGPTDCCTSPSSGFTYTGTATFNVESGQTYGFRLSGSNFDSDNTLRGTLTLATKAFTDPTIGQDNRQWQGAATLPADGVDGTLDEPGETRWFRFPVVPGQRVGVDLTDLPLDYDVALYSDIGAAFQRLQDTSDASRLASASAGAPGAQTQVPDYPASITQVPTSTATLPSTSFAPRIYAPRIYAPRIYAPRIYAPRIYAPRIYAPRIYAPDGYSPDLDSDPAFQSAFSAAQNQSLLAVSAETGTAPETVAASTGNTDGYFYVRVQAHSDKTFSKDRPFHLARTVTGGTACAGLDDFASTSTLAPTSTTARTVVVTDTNKLGLAAGSAEQATYLDALDRLAGATDGAVVDVSRSDRVVALQRQAAAHPDCPYATNLVARAVQQVVESYRNGGSRYVVLAGGDDVIPFFRYPDVSGLGQESQFSPPVMADTAAGNSLSQDQVQSQDAYGSSTEVTIGGVTLPVPDLAVGRLVKTPEEIESTIDNYLQLDHGTLPAPTSSLVTGYDFLADAAHGVDDQFTAALPGGTHDRLIAEAGTPHADSWTGTQLGHALLDRHHDLVYLAGHFSANDTLAADFTTTFDADELAGDGPHADALRNTLVLSAGCHSGYTIVDGAAVPDRTNTFDWTQRMAQQHAVLIGGTGYQYGDTDFLAYSERVYLDVARRLREGTSSGPNDPVAVGRALTLAKQDYLASLGTVTGIDQKAVLEATLYGLPMTGFDAPGRSPVGGDASSASPTPVTDAPGSTLGLSSDDLTLGTGTRAGSKPSGAGSGLPASLTWLNGADGVSVQPGAPALPQQVEDVSAPGQTLRGVGFRSGDYTDTPGVLPLTGAPAIEGSTANTTFESSAFWPQRLVTPNYFGALGSSGRTSLVVTPAQYRSDPGGALTDTQRSYSALGVRLFYSDQGDRTFGGNRPTSAAPPTIGEVSGTSSGGSVTFSARVTGDPSAGVQQVWVTWTGTGDDSGHGHWRSVDLTQDPQDSSHWTGALALPDGQPATGVRFLVQAANGAGAVALDTADGDGYSVRPAGPRPVTVALGAHAPTTASPLGVTAGVVDDAGDPVAGRIVRFTTVRNGVTLFTTTATSAADGAAEATVPAGQQKPSGRLRVTAELLDGSGAVTATDSLETTLAGLLVTATPPGLVARAGLALPGPFSATVTDARGPAVGVPVTFTLPATGPRATFPGGARTATVPTDASGRAVAPATGGAVTAPVVGVFVATVAADGTDATATVPVAAQYALDPFLAAPASTRLSLSTLSQLVQARRVQVRWRLASPGSPWLGARTDLGPTLFRQLLGRGPAGTSLGLARKNTYVVQLRVLPARTDPRPVGDTDLAGSFDLGSLSWTIVVR